MRHSRGTLQACCVRLQSLGYVQIEWDAELPPPELQQPVPQEVPQPAGVKGKDKGWAEMAGWERSAAAALGYDESSWEAGASTPACSKPWQTLSIAERQAAEVRVQQRVPWLVPPHSSLVCGA